MMQALKGWIGAQSSSGAMFRAGFSRSIRLLQWTAPAAATSDPFIPVLLIAAALIGLLLMGLTITFMSVDWAMSLDPRWFSSIYGMLFNGPSHSPFFNIGAFVQK